MKPQKPWQTREYKLAKSRRQYAKLKLLAGEEGWIAAPGGRSCALMSMTECAQKLGISRQAVHQLERSAFRKIRMALLPILKELNPELYEQILR